MRSLPLVVLAVLPLAGCEWGFVSPFSSWGSDEDSWWGDTGGSYSNDPYFRSAEGMTQASSLWNVADGLAFNDDGTLGAASMWSVNCRFQTSTGMIDVEDPEATEDDEIQDGEDKGPGFVVVATANDTIRITEYGDMGATTVDSIRVPGVVSVRLDGDDVVYGAQDGGCQIGWTGSDRVVRVGTLCGGFDTTESGTVITAADGVVKVVTEAGAVTDLGASAELVAWDPVHDQIYTAVTGGSTVTALSIAGDVRWTATLEGRITSLTDMGSRGAALVGLEVDGLGRVAVLDGASGAEIAWGEANEAPTALWASPDGSTFAARTSWNTHFVRMD